MLSALLNKTFPSFLDHSIAVAFTGDSNLYFCFSGYVQGMSDLLSPILVVMENEVDAFWCFAGIMERLVGKTFKYYRDVPEFAAAIERIFLQNKSI